MSQVSFGDEGPETKSWGRSSTHIDSRPSSGKESHASWTDWAGGGSLGVLLGLLIGLSATPIVSTVISALVALLAALFGFSEKTPLMPASGSAHRLIAFSLCAALLTPAGIYFRTHNTFAPSLEEYKADLLSMGYAGGSREQTEVLGYLRYGLLPSNRTEGERAGPHQSVLYSDAAAELCAEVARLKTVDDLLVVLSQSPSPLPKMAETIRDMPATQQAAAVAFAQVFLCT